MSSLIVFTWTTDHVGIDPTRPNARAARGVAAMPSMSSLVAILRESGTEPDLRHVEIERTANEVHLLLALGAPGVVFHGPLSGQLRYRFVRVAGNLIGRGMTESEFLVSLARRGDINEPPDLAAALPYVREALARTRTNWPIPIVAASSAPRRRKAGAGRWVA